MDHASYLNPYPIMSADFCERVGEPNATLGRPPNCAAIDYDALLLGGCFCHYCLLQVLNEARCDLPQSHLISHKSPSDLPRISSGPRQDAKLLNASTTLSPNLT